MRTATYTRFELLRIARNRRILLFSLIFPVVLYLLIAGPQKGEDDLDGTGLSAPLYFMASMASWGTMTSMLSVGGRIAADRQSGWNRQLRVSPLSARTYLQTKVLTGYLTATLTLLVLYALGAAFGVRLPALDWLEMTGLIAIGLIPFAALGVALGHVVPIDSFGAVIGGGTALLAFVSGTWFPLDGTGLIHDIGIELPSYWLVQANRVALHGGAWSMHGWIVVAAWSVALAGLAAHLFRRDTSR